MALPSWWMMVMIMAVHDQFLFRCFFLWVYVSYFPTLGKEEFRCYVVLREVHTIWASYSSTSTVIMKFFWVSTNLHPSLLNTCVGVIWYQFRDFTWKISPSPQATRSCEMKYPSSWILRHEISGSSSSSEIFVAFPASLFQLVRILQQASLLASTY